MHNIATIKRCSKCKMLKQAERDFHRASKTKDGLHYWCKRCSIDYLKRPAAKETARKYREGLRLTALIKYGGSPPKCACCGEMNLKFLGIDHINGGGRKHRAQMYKEGHETTTWLRKNNYPDGFRVLCHNCNMAFGFYGACPHSTMEEYANG